jgi:selenocysteine lyase/cysteine desulfurase
LISNHEEQLANPLLEYINTRDDIRLIGKKKIENKNRAPTISFTFNNKSSKNLSKELVNHGIATRNDNFYAWRCLNALNIDPNDGVVRTSMVHYNTHEDVNKLISALKKI